jgi:hypothetical protein
MNVCALQGGIATNGSMPAVEAVQFGPQVEAVETYATSEVRRLSSWRHLDPSIPRDIPSTQHSAGSGENDTPSSNSSMGSSNDDTGSGDSSNDDTAPLHSSSMDGMGSVEGELQMDMLIDAWEAWPTDVFGVYAASTFGVGLDNPIAPHGGLSAQQLARAIMLEATNVRLTD